MLEEEIADFHRRKAQYEAEKMNSGHHTLTLGKLGKKKQTFIDSNRQEIGRPNLDKANALDY